MVKRCAILETFKALLTAGRRKVHFFPLPLVEISLLQSKLNDLRGDYDTVRLNLDFQYNYNAALQAACKL